MALLFGAEAVSPIKIIYKEFIRKRIAIAKKSFEKEFTKYLPIISNSQNFDCISDIEHLLTQSSQISPQYYITIISRPEYERLPSLKPFSGKDPKYIQIYDDVKALAVFEENIDSALQLLELKLPWSVNLFKTVISEVIPVKLNRGREYKTNFGFSDFRLIGAIFTSIRSSKYPLFETAQSLVHEMGHNIVYLLQTGQDLFESRETTHIYSGIRKVDRPIYGAFHGAVALAYMKILVKSILDSSSYELLDEAYAKALFNTHSSSLNKGLKPIKELKLTDLGKALLKELESADELKIS